MSVVFLLLASKVRINWLLSCLTFFLCATGRNGAIRTSSHATSYEDVGKMKGKVIHED